MSFLLPILVVGATLTGSPSIARESPAEVTSVSVPPMSLLAAASESARRESPALERTPAVGPLAARPGSARRTDRHSPLTRATAIFAGAVLGSFAGVVGGAAVDMATSNGECLTNAKYGMFVGAAVGGLLTARWVR